jgi:hypothetical protein
MFPAYFESRPIPFGIRNRQLELMQKQKKRDAMSIAPRFSIVTGTRADF